MFQYRAGIIWGGRESAARFSFQGICCSRFLLPRILQLYGILQLRFQGWIAKKGRMSYPIYIYSSNVPAYNRLFSFKMIHRPDSRRINWKYFWNIAFQILQVTVIVSIYFFFPTFCFPRNFKREREENIDWTFYERPFDHFYSRVKVKNIGCVNYRSIPLHKRLNKIGRNRRISRIKKFWTTILNKSQNLKMELLKITRLKNLSL